MIDDTLDMKGPYAVRRRDRRPSASQPRTRKRRFTSEEIAEAIRQWVKQYGELPTVADWEPSRARRAGQEWRAERFEQGSWPSLKIVRREFGTLSAAVQAAGLRPRPAPSRIRPTLLGPDEVLRAIREWTRRYGEPPTMADWEPSRARRNGDLWRIARFKRGDWPSARTVCAHFGSFTKAVAEAGLTPRPPGQRQNEVERLRAQSRELLEEWRVSPDTGLGPVALARCTRDVVHARKAGNAGALSLALMDLAATALKWADQVAAANMIGQAPPGEGSNGGGHT